ncbi:MAG: ornithine cyclodeaminase family protein [Marinifilaceae bacterium]|jgi:ornithine cyclodeaminase|nr:ornithine cyclodeaminase family protein [Marinifilaceae bacterium]
MIAISEELIDRLVSPSEAIKSVEQAFKFHYSKSFIMPNRSHSSCGDNTLLLMPCFTKYKFGTKLVNVNSNIGDKSLPAVNGVMILNDSETGLPLSIINGAKLTSVRTGAVGAVGVKYLSNLTDKYLGVVGAGVQAYTQVLSIATVRDITDVFIFDQDPKKGSVLISKLKNKLSNINFHICKKVEDLLFDSEIVVTTTSSSNPVLPENRKILEGKTYIAIGSYKPEMRELPSSLFGLLDKIWVDTQFAVEESGDLSYPLAKDMIDFNQVKLLSHLIVKPGIKDNRATRLFKSVGMALFDLCLAETLYNKAKKYGEFQSVKL